MAEQADDSERKPKTAKAVDPMLRVMGERLREVRERKRRGLVETAKAATMSKGFLWRTEAGQQNLSVKTLARIALALDVTMAELLKGVPALIDHATGRDGVADPGEDSRSED